MAMEDFRVDVVVGKGPGATAIPLEIPPFTLVGATTRAGLLPGPLRDRFGFTAHLDFYEPRRARARSCTARPACSSVELDRRRGRRDRLALPRHAAHRQPAAAPGPRLRPGARRRRRRPATSPALRWSSTRSTSSASTGSTGRCSTRCAAASAAGRWACRTLAVAVGEERETVEEVAEPFLVRDGLLARTPRGRVATPAAWAAPRAVAPKPPGAARRAALFETTRGRIGVASDGRYALHVWCRTVPVLDRSRAQRAGSLASLALDPSVASCAQSARALS